MRVSSLGREDPQNKAWQPFQYSCLENSKDRGAGRSQRVGQTEHACIYIIINEIDNTWKTPIYCESVINMEAIRGLTAVTLQSGGLGSDGDGCLSLA